MKSLAVAVSFAILLSTAATAQSTAQVNKPAPPDSKQKDSWDDVPKLKGHPWDDVPDWEPSQNSPEARTESAREDRAFYTEYLPRMSGFTADCEKPLLNDLMPWSSLEACEAMYKARSYIELTCERDALFKQRTAPHLLGQYDVKWLSNIANRRRACMDLLAEKGKLGLWDKISRWWKTEQP